MTTRNEGAGRRTYRPKHNSLRAKLLAYFTENPESMLARVDIGPRYGVTDQSVQYAITFLRRDGLIKTVYGPNRTTYYALTTLDVKLAKSKQPKAIRVWPEHSTYAAPKPIPVSIWHFAEMA